LLAVGSSVDGCTGGYLNEMMRYDQGSNMMTKGKFMPFIACFDDIVAIDSD